MSYQEAFLKAEYSDERRCLISRLALEDYLIGLILKKKVNAFIIA